MENHRRRHHHHHHHLREPLIQIQPPNTTDVSYSETVIDMATTPRDQDSDHDPPSKFCITFRLSFLALLALVSLWANLEASRGFSITIINAAGDQTFAGKRFHLFYESNDEATRMVIKASKAIETFLYPDNDHIDSKKEIASIIFKLAGSNSSDEFIVVDSEGVFDEFVLNLSPSILEGSDFRHDMLLAVQQGVARVWLWDGQGESPKDLINGIVEYITSNLGGFGRLPEEAAPPQEGFSSAACWKRQDPRAVAGFLKHCERRRPGFISRLNRGMKYGWHDDMFGVALGMPVLDLCTSFRQSLSDSVVCYFIGEVSVVLKQNTTESYIKYKDPKHSTMSITKLKTPEKPGEKIEIK